MDERNCRWRSEPPSPALRVSRGRKLLQTVFWLSLGACALSGKSADFPLRTFGLYVEFEREPAHEVVSALQKELNGLMSPVGLPVEWRTIQDHLPFETFLDVAIVHFRGTCRVFEDIAVDDVGALASTNITDGAIQAFTDIDCDRIRLLLSGGLSRRPRFVQESYLGRAIARVLAHELYHVLTRKLHHSASGLEKTALGATELLAPALHYSEMDQQILIELLAEKYDEGSGTRPWFATLSEFVRDGCVRCHGSRAEGSWHGPAIRASRVPWKIEQVLAKLTSKTSVMCRRSRPLKLPWSTLSNSRIELLVSYLNALPN